MTKMDKTDICHQHRCNVDFWSSTLFSGISGEYLNLQWNSDGTKCPSTITPTLLYDKCWFCACDTCKETVFLFQNNQLDLKWFSKCKMWSRYWQVKSSIFYFLSTSLKMPRKVLNRLFSRQACHISSMMFQYSMWVIMWRFVFNTLKATLWQPVDQTGSARCFL